MPATTNGRVRRPPLAGCTCAFRGPNRNHKGHVSSFWLSIRNNTATGARRFGGVSKPSLSCFCGTTKRGAHREPTWQTDVGGGRRSNRRPRHPRPQLTTAMSLEPEAEASATSADATTRKRSAAIGIAGRHASTSPRRRMALFCATDGRRRPYEARPLPRERAWASPLAGASGTARGSRRPARGSGARALNPAPECAPGTTTAHLSSQNSAAGRALPEDRVPTQIAADRGERARRRDSAAGSAGSRR